MVRIRPPRRSRARRAVLKHCPISLNDVARSLDLFEASSCSSRRGSAGNASYASRVDFLGVSYVIEGVFASIGGGQVIQLEVVAPDRKNLFARGLLAAWLTKTTQ